MTETEKNFFDDEGIERLTDGTATSLKYLGVRLFSTNPAKYEYSDRFEIGREINN